MIHKYSNAYILSTYTQNKQYSVYLEKLRVRNNVFEHSFLLHQMQDFISMVYAIHLNRGF